MNSALRFRLRRRASLVLCWSYLIALLIALTSCSSSPSAGDGKRSLQDRIEAESEGRIKLAKFQKTNGAQGELMGFKIYALEFDAEIEFTENCKWGTGMFGERSSFRTTEPVAEPQSGFNWKKFLDDSQNPGPLVKKGQRVQISGVVRFVKKEKGWAVQNIELTRTTPVTGSIRSSAKSVADSAAFRADCVANLKTIDGAKSIWALEYRKQQIDTPTDANLFGPVKYIREKPVCPAGGIYTINPVDTMPTCTVPGHEL